MDTVRRILQVKGFDVWSISPEETVFEALRLMADKDIGAVLVMESDHLVGILSERDYARKVILLGRTSKDTLVNEIMTRKLYDAHPEETTYEVLQLMNEKHIRHLPIVENEKVIGIISIGDVVRNIIYHQKETIRDLEGRLLGRTQ